MAKKEKVENPVLEDIKRREERAKKAKAKDK